MDPRGQFIATAGFTILVSMIVLALAISNSMKESVLQSVSEESAALIASVLGPSVQELSNSPRLSPETMSDLDEVLKEQLSSRLTAIKIWLRDGTLVYATDRKLIGEKFPSHELDEAFQGKVSATLDDMDGLENQFDRLLNRPLIEIYAPLYRTGTHEIIAVGEFYSDGENLASIQRSLRFTTAGIVCAVIAPMMMLLFLIVRRAGATIEQQQAALTQKIHEAQQLRQAAEDARLEAVRSNERLLTQIGQDLHDGPVQLLGMLMLKLTQSDVDGGKPVEGANPPHYPGSPDSRSLTSRILKEIRDISAGLVLPQLGNLSIAKIIDLAVRQHEYTTGTSVSCEIGNLPAEMPAEIGVCVFRAVQEALNNCFYHAGGKDQRVTCQLDRGFLCLTVSDGGSASLEREPGTRARLGLSGIERRVEALGGSFKISFNSATGTLVRIELPVPSSVEQHM